MTTIKVSSELRLRLEGYKVHPREPLEEVIRKVLDELDGLRENEMKVRFNGDHPK